MLATAENKHVMTMRDMTIGMDCLFAKVGAITIIICPCAYSVGYSYLQISD